MRRRVLVIGLILVTGGALAVVNSFQPSRLPASTLQESLEVQERLAEETPATETASQEENLVVAQAAAENKDKEKEVPSDTADVVRVKFETTKGDFIVEVYREWAPNGFERFVELVNMGFFDDCRFFRVVTKPRPFVVQWGIPGDPKLAGEWWNKTIKDDPVKHSNEPGTLVFAAGGAPNSRSTQMFINFSHNKFLDNYGGRGFPPIGKVVEGMDIVKQFNDQYQDSPTSMQQQMVKNGNDWLDEKFPGLDYIKKASVVPQEEEKK